MLPFLDYIGWDICIGREEIIVIEANNAPAMTVFQVHRPLLSDERLRDFYRAYNVI